MLDRSFLFIVEGETDEPAFIKQMFQKCYPQLLYKTYSYKTNLHILAKRLEEDYPDFVQDETDIRLILRSYENSKEQRDILDGKYTDIFMIFDFEPQHNLPHFETIRSMLNYYSDSSSQGKLFINYPMMQSYKHFSALPDPEFYLTSVTSDEWSNYKEIVGKVSRFSDVSKYTYPTFVSITAHHLMKANYILTGLFVLPTKEQYEVWKLTEIFEKQVENKNQRSFVYVLNTCIFILVDYGPISFFKLLKVLGA